MITNLNIQGMHCASCKLLIEDVCRDIPGVASCTVDVATHSAKIDHDASVTEHRIRREIEGLGDYKVSMA
jgi:copper chaperone CopZ